MAVEVAEQCIYGKHLPKMLLQEDRVNILLFFNSFQNIFEFCTAAIRIRIQNRILNGTEIIKFLSVSGKVQTGTDNFLSASYCKCSQHGFLCFYFKHVKNTAGNVFADTAVGIGQLSRLSFAGRWKLQHIWSAVIFHGYFFAVRPVICPVKYTGTVRKVDTLSHTPVPFHKYFCLR